MNAPHPKTILTRLAAALALSTASWIHAQTRNAPPPASEEGAAISDTRSSDRGVADRSDASAAANSGGGIAESDTSAD